VRWDLQNNAVSDYCKTATALVTLMTSVAAAHTRAAPQQSAGPSAAPVVMTVGCAEATARPEVWNLSHAGERSQSSRAGITIAEKGQLEQRPLGQTAYQLIGVADFVDAETSRTIGVRAEILPLARVNATGMLVSGHKVAVKGLYIDARPARINLTSVIDLGPRCP
jgi:hypothetical protein